MKLKIISLVAATVVLLSCGPSRYNNSSSNTAYRAPRVIVTSFETRYPDATDVVWSNYDPAVTTPVDWDLNDWSVLNSGDYVARFNVGKDQYYAWYDASGNWIGSTYAIGDYSMLPPSVSTVLRDKYNGYNIESVHKEMWKDRNAYEIKLRNGDAKVKMLVDVNGNIIKQKDRY
jgi:hypothetical protein